MPSAIPKPAPAPEPESELEHTLLADSELNKPQWSMPPTLVAVVGLVVLAAMVGVVSYFSRPTANGTGYIESVTAIAQAPEQVLTTMKVGIQNTGSKDLRIRDVKVTLKTASGDKLGTLASIADHNALFRQYPDIREKTIAPITPNEVVPAGLQTRGSLIVSFPVSLDTFNANKGMDIAVETFEGVPIKITK